MEKSKKKLVGNLFLNNIYQILILIVPLITAPYIARVLGASGVGISSYTMSLVTYFTLVAGLGTVSYGTREISRCRDDKKEYSKKFWEIEIVSVIASIVAVAFWLILSFCYVEYRPYLLILTLSILATCLDISWLYAGLEKFKYSIIINLLFRFLGIFLIFALVKNPNNIGMYLLIHAGTMVLANLSMWLFLPKIITKTKIKMSSIKHHFKESFIYFVPTIAISIYTVLDKSLIGMITHDSTQNGYYEQAIKIIRLIQSISFMGINGVMMSRSSYLFVENDKEKIRNNLLNTFNLNLLVAIPSVFGIAGIASVFVPWFFGEGYDQSIILIYILALIILIICVSHTLGSLYYTPAGKIKQSSKYLIIGSITNLILNLCLIPFIGAYGAAIASVIAELVITILYFINCNKIVRFKDIIKLSYKRIIAASIMLLYVLVCNQFIHIPAIGLLCIDIFGAIFIYGIMLIILHDDFVINILKMGINKLLRRNKDELK